MKNRRHTNRPLCVMSSVWRTIKKPLFSLSFSLSTYKYILHFHFKGPFFSLSLLSRPKDLTTHFATTRTLEGISTAHRHRQRPFVGLSNIEKYKRRESTVKWAIHRPSGKDSATSWTTRERQRGDEIDESTSFSSYNLRDTRKKRVERQFMIAPPSYSLYFLPGLMDDPSEKERNPAEHNRANTVGLHLRIDGHEFSNGTELSFLLWSRHRQEFNRWTRGVGGIKRNGLCPHVTWVIDHLSYWVVHLNRSDGDDHLGLFTQFQGTGQSNNLKIKLHNH